jgi:molybdate transport system substrate-binding protein
MSDKKPVLILSADAPKAGLRKNAELFTKESAIPHQIELATGPVIKQRVLAGDANDDIVVIPRPEFDDLISAGRVDRDELSVLGFVTVGVTIKKDAREPDIRSVDGFKASVLAAGRVIYNTASSGQYIAALFDRLGLADKIKDKVSIYPTGKTAMEALAADTSGNAIGFGHVTEIRLHDPLGTRLVGPLPKEIGRQTPYAAGLLKSARQPDTARRLVAFMIGPRGKQIFLDTGVTQESR